MLNGMSIITLKKLGNTKSSLVSIDMKMSNFIGDVTTTIGVLVVDITVEPKTLRSTCFYNRC